MFLGRKRSSGKYFDHSGVLQKRSSIRTLRAADGRFTASVRAQGGTRGGNSEQKAEIPASGAPVGRAAHARLITILFDDSPPPS